MHGALSVVVDDYIPEMRAIWDAMRPHLQNVMNGESSPEEAARAMQEEAVRKIAEMKG